MLPPSTLVHQLPGLINAHVHGTYGPQYRGVKASAPFDLAGVDLMARETHEPLPGEFFACALVTGYENLRAGNTAIIDHYYGPLTRAHIRAVATAYEQIGIRAWVLVELTDLPWLFYTREAYPRFSRSVPLSALPDDLRALVEAQPSAGVNDVGDVIKLIQEWQGERVRIGLALGNPLWCSDDLMREVAAAAADLAVPLTTHVEESALQREVSLAQWGLTAVERLHRSGALSKRTVLSHAVHIGPTDVELVAKRRASISHNPLSNLKLQVGIAPVGDWIRNNVNVCLGSDGQSSGDSQNLFSVMKVTAGLADLNGLRAQVERPEETVLAMATENAALFWPDDDLSQDLIEFSEPLGPNAHVWDEPAAYIAEVYVDGAPRLASAREVLASTAATDIVVELRKIAVAEPQLERAKRLTETLRDFLVGESDQQVEAGVRSVMSM
jgi:cytosine/adenosine deaminase-related metal-dependent hydrolase